MTTTLDLTGVHCQMCVKRLTGAFEAVPGVTAARVTLSPPRVGSVGVQRNKQAIRCACLGTALNLPDDHRDAG